MCRKSTFSVSTWKHLPLQVGATICGLKRLYHHNYQVLTKFPSSCMKGQNLIIVMIKAFSIHKLWLLSRGGGVSTEKVFWRHIIGGLLRTKLQQAVLHSIKEKIWRSWKLRVVVAQWLEYWWLKPVSLGSIPGDNQYFSFFSFTFSSGSL